VISAKKGGRGRFWSLREFNRYEDSNLTRTDAEGEDKSIVVLHAVGGDGGHG